MYDLAILGGGPAGVAAGVYAARKQLKTIFITENFEGQSNVSEGVENWIGTIKIPGPELSKNLEAHLRAYAGTVVEIKTKERVAKIDKLDKGFKITTSRSDGQAGSEYEALTILVTTGSARRKLDVPGAAEFENKGLTYCASCDGPLFAGQDVAVVGGGNAGFETAAQLLAYCKSVALLNRTEMFKADPVTIEKVSAHPNMRVLKNVTPVEIKGDKFVTGIVYEDNATKEKHELAVQGVFIEIGAIPNSIFIKDLVDLDEYNRIKVDPWTQRASLPGIWAAGDVTTGLYHQNNIAAGDAVKAIEDIYLYLRA